MILVLGGAGYIGSHIVKRLLTDGQQVVVYDDLSQGHEAAIEGVTFVRGTIEDGPSLRQTMRDFGVKSVMHFAAFCYVGESVEKPLRYYRNNVVGSVSVLEAMRAEGVERIIFSSSAATYGIPGTVPITESEPQQPINPYGRTKLMVEQVMADSDTAWGLRYTALRYFNAAGADVDGKLGEWHDPETHLIPLACYAALGTIPAFTIHGDTYDTPDGSCVRDFIHVDDLADAHVRALNRLESGAPSRSYNLGNGEGFSVRQVAEAVRDVSGKDFSIVTGPPRPGDPPVLVADAAAARAELGWTPRYSDLDTIVRTSWNWLDKHPQGYGS